MHSHNHDLIAALAEGILADELIAAAEAEFEACDECSAELAAQRFALHSLTALQAPSMTAAESAGVRKGVATALGLSEVPVPRRSRRSPWPAIAFAAGLAGVLALVPALGLINLSGGDDADSSAATVFAAEIEEDATNDPAADEIAYADGVATTAASGADLTTTAPEMEAPVAASEPTEALMVTTTLAVELGQQETSTRKAIQGEDEIRDLFAAGPADDEGATGDPAERSNLACSGAAEQSFGNSYLHVPVSASLDDGSSVILYATSDWAVLIAFDLETCAPAFQLP